MSQYIEYIFYTSLLTFGSYVAYNLLTRKKDKNQKVKKEVEKRVAKALNISKSDLHNQEKVLMSLYDILIKYKEKDLYTEEEVKEIIVISAEKMAEKTFEEFSIKLAKSLESLNYFENPESLLEQLPYNEIITTFTKGIKDYLKENEEYNKLSDEEKEKVLKEVFNRIKEKYNKTIEIKSEDIEEIFKEILKTITTEKIKAKESSLSKTPTIEKRPIETTTTIIEKPELKLIRDIGLKEEPFTSSVITKKLIEEFQKTTEYYKVYDHFKEFLIYFKNNFNQLNGVLFPEGDLTIHIKDLIQTLKEYIEELESKSEFNIDTFNSLLEQDITIIYSQKATNYEFYTKVVTGEVGFRHPLFYTQKTDLFRTNLFRYLPVYRAFIEEKIAEEIRNNTIEFIKNNTNKRQIGLVKNAILKRTDTRDYEQVIEDFDIIAIKIKGEPIILTWKGIALYLGEKYTYFEYLFNDLITPIIKRNGLNIYVDPTNIKVKCSFSKQPREFKYSYKTNLYIENIEECETQ